MEPTKLSNPRIVATSASEGIVEEVITSKRITIARNKVGSQAFMNNAPVDNFGTKQYQHCIFGDITVNLDCSAVPFAKSSAQSSWPPFSLGSQALPAKAISSAVDTSYSSIQSQNSIQLFSKTGQKSGQAQAKLCPELSSNWISVGLVRLCKFEPIRRRTVKKAEYEGQVLISTGELVELVCPGKPCSHRFHIIEDALLRVDLLYGVDFVEKTK